MVVKSLHIVQILLLLTTIPFFSTYNHFCGSILIEANTLMVDHCCKTNGQPDDCCHNELAQGTENHEFIGFSFEWTPLLPLIKVHDYNLSEILLTNDLQHHKYLNFSPPLVNQDIYIIVQSFLN